MASDKKRVEYFIKQMELSGLITTKPMMGEYLLYCDGVYVALVSDNSLFVKPTEAGKLYIGNMVEKSAYPGAKPSFYIGSKCKDRKWLAELIKRTRDELSKIKRPAKQSVGTRKNSTKK